MVFSSFAFLFRFLPIFLFIYYVAPDKWKNAVLFGGSILFYTVGESHYVILLLLSVCVNFCAGKCIARAFSSSHRLPAKICFFIALFYNLGMLFLFKYCHISRALPLGISFYTFQITAYLIDVYRQQIQAESSFVRLGTYLTMFPQLIAGPIINYSDVKDALYSRRVTVSQLEEGLTALILGLGSKIILANHFGMLWTQIQAIGFSSISTPLAWIGAYTYSLQLYFDFAGYSMMAIGLGQMLGFEIPVNFDHPYISTSVTEFWRRWHITLGKWFRDYVYIPLGGNRKGKARTFRNLILVWVLTALWHGFGPGFAVWGGILLFCLILEKLFLLHFLQNKRVLGHLYVLLVIPLSWIPFAISQLADTGTYFLHMFPFVIRLFPSLEALYTVQNPNDFVPYMGRFLPMFLLGILFCTTLPSDFIAKCKKKWIKNAVLLFIFLLSLYYLSISVNNPFMYFNF